MKSVELKQSRQHKIEAQTAIVEKAKKESRSELTAEEKQKFDDLQNEIEGLTADISRAEKFEENQRLAAEGAKIITPDAGDDGTKAEMRKINQRFSVVKMIRAALEGEKLSGAELDAHEIALEENRNAGLKVKTRANKVFVPMAFKRAWAQNRADQQTVTQDAGEYGAFLTVDQAPQVVDGLEPKLWIQELGATVLSGLSGGNIPMPVANSYNFAWAAEGAAISVQKNKFEGPTLSPKRAAAAVSLTNQMIMQSSPSVEAIVRQKLSEGYAKLINGAAINGAGGAAPTGILNYTGVTAAADVANFAATFAKIVELEGLIDADDATENSRAYLLHPVLEAVLRTKTKDSGSGRFILENGSIDGRQYRATSLVPVGDDAGTAVYPVIFGDFAQLYVGQWGSMGITVNPYSEDLADSVRMVLNTHADVQIANPKAFAQNSFFNAS
jgi:HK97 family phage major capsid protein